MQRYNLNHHKFTWNCIKYIQVIFNWPLYREMFDREMVNVPPDQRVCFYTEQPTTAMLTVINQSETSS